ncbi:MAG: DoxX family protein [Alphaproteobacteria bacterium]|nr:DoxX family protein [Alphaproteobacteria bacterium]
MLTRSDLVCWPLAGFATFIFIRYLEFKFGGHPGSVFLFTVLTDWLFLDGLERWMRVGVGSMELLAGILLMIRPTQVIGAALAAGIMSGAIFFHIVSPLGIDPYHDGGKLFTEACLVLTGALIILGLRRAEAFALLARIGIQVRV